MSKPKATDTLVSKLKAAARERAKKSGQARSVELENVAREHGFDSWYEVTQRNRSEAGSRDSDLPIDPDLPPDFFNTPNAFRSDEDIAQWWLRPFAQRNQSGGFTACCLDGGAWDRPTIYGDAPDLAAAQELAQTKLAKRRAIEDEPLVLPAEGAGSWRQWGACIPRCPVRS